MHDQNKPEGGGGDPLPSNHITHTHMNQEGGGSGIKQQQ